MKFFKTHWFSILLVGVLCYILLKSQSKINELEEEAIKIENVNKILESQADSLLEEIDALSERDTVYLDSLVYIKEKSNDKIKAVDTMSISELQSFFTERYPKDSIN